MKNQPMDLDFRLSILGLNKEDLLGLNKEEQKRVLKKAYHQKAMQTHPDVNLGKDDKEFKFIKKSYEDLLRLVKKGKFSIKKEAKIESPFVDFTNKHSDRKKMEEMLKNFEPVEHKEKREPAKKSKIDNMIKKFNSRVFSIKDAINGLNEKDNEKDKDVR